MVSLPVFYLYAVMLTLSGITMLTFAIGGFGQRIGARIAETLFGAGFLGYGVYLLVFFTGGEFTMFYYAFVAPILAVVHVVRSRRPAAPAPQFAPPRYREFGQPAAGTPAPSFTPANGLVPATAPLGSPLPPRQARRTGSSTSL